MIDTHAHVYAEEFDNDGEVAIDRAKKGGVTRILMPAIDASTHENMIGVEKRHPQFCISMMGLHPCSVKANFKEELKVVEGYFGQRKFVAVGETGLDFYWDLTFKEQQYEAFHQQADWALHFDIPLVIHSRNSTDECIEVVSQHQKGQLKGVFHCFSGNADQAKRIIDLGFYLGIGGVLTFKNSGLDKAIRDIDLKHIILETDAPYLAPVPYRGKRNECSYIIYTAQKLADERAMSVKQIDDITTANAKKLFGLS